MSRVRVAVMGMVCAVTALLFAAAPAQAIVVSLESFTGATATAKIEILDIGDDLTFRVFDVSPLADIRGVFFNVTDESILGPDLVATGAHVTGQQYKANAVSDLGGGANIHPGVFDAGVEIGTSGIGGDDIQETLFTLSHSSIALDLTHIVLPNGLGLRIMSVEEDGDREGSSKLTSVPEPMTAGLGLLGLTALSVSLRRRRA